MNHPLLVILPLLIAGSLSTFGSAAIAQETTDCAHDSPKTIFIGFRSGATDGSGTRKNPFDGSTKQKFDKILRDRSEAGETDLIVCIGPGTYLTEGSYDYIIGVGHQAVLDYKSSPRGFTVGKNWKIHGAGSSGPNRTVLRLSDIYPRPRAGFPLGSAVIATVSDTASGVEVSDLEIDDNYVAIQGNANLSAITLRSDEGGHWIHRIHVINAEGKFSETFPILIMSVNFQKPRSQNNLIEHVTMDGWAGGLCTAIAIANAAGEVRYNTVHGYQIAFGGWAIGSVRYHDNESNDSMYGFNIDSDENDQVVIEHNRIIHPTSYGVVIGGSARYSNFQIQANTIEINRNSVVGILFQGRVTNALVAGNAIVSDTAAPHGVSAVEFRGKGNLNNIFRVNQVDSGFSAVNLDKTSCLFSNTDEKGRPAMNLVNNQNHLCAQH